MTKRVIMIEGGRRIGRTAALTAAVAHVMQETAKAVGVPVERMAGIPVGSRSEFERLYMQQMPEPRSWYCEPCAVEVYDRVCKICGKTERQKR